MDLPEFISKAGIGVDSHFGGLPHSSMLAALQHGIGELRVTGQSSVSGNPYPA